MKFEPWMKTALIVVGIVILIIFVVFLYLFIAGADESRKRESSDRLGNENE